MAVIVAVSAFLEALVLSRHALLGEGTCASVGDSDIVIAADSGASPGD